MLRSGGEKVMEKAVIYGCGKIGKSVYENYKGWYDFLFFVDKNAEKIKEYNGVPVYLPQKLIEYPNIKIIIAGYYYKDMLTDLESLEIGNRNIELFKPGFEPVLSKTVTMALDKRTINLGEWFRNSKNLSCKELTFIPGGSQILDYMFLKQIAIKSGSREYLEIGTYIGESINILTDCCEKLYSVTLPIESARKFYDEQFKMKNYVGRLVNDEKVTTYYTDSRQFDFSKHSETVDLYFIDGDHSYEGVYNDTKNVFMNKKEDAIVVWHDFKYTDTKYKAMVINAVYDALGDEFDNVYVTDNNACGIYIPPNRINEFGFVMYEGVYEEDAPLYTYDVILNCGVKK